MNTCFNTQCYCEVEDCSKQTIDGIDTVSDEKYANTQDLNNLLDLQRDILEQINLLKLEDYSDVQINTQVKDLKHMLEMVLMKLQFWDYEHEKTLLVSPNTDNTANSANPANTVDNEFELVMLDNEVAHCAVEKSQISSEEELDAVLNIDVADDVADDLVIDAVEVELPNQDTNFEVDEDIIEDVDLELEPVDFEDEVGDVAEIPDDEVQEITDVNDETDYEQDTSVISGFPDILADDNGTAMNFGNIKDLLSMLFTMSMATDSESIINTNGESYADTYADTYGDTTTNYPSASDPDELD